MTVDISGFALRIQMIASNTLPIGHTFTQFPDDTDPLDLPALQIADSAMGLNGDLITWSKANPIKPAVALIAGSEDDVIMGIVFEANRVGRGKIGARDIITLTFMYPDGRVVTLTSGIITDGMPGNGIASAGRYKTKIYNFSFENRIGVGA